MRYFFYVLLCCCSIVLTGCPEAEKPVGPSPNNGEPTVTGEWELVRREGRFNGSSTELLEEGNRPTLVLYANGCYYWSFPEDSSSRTGTYRLVKSPIGYNDKDSILQIEFNNGGRTPITFTEDSLVLDGTSWDGTRDTYKRKGLAEVCGITASAMMVPLALIDPFWYPFEWQEVEVAGDVLCAVVQYSGGCQEHQFHLLVDMNASPPDEIEALLTHNANADECESILTSKVGFDLTPLKEHLRTVTGQNSGTAVLRIQGNGRKHVVYYNY